MPRQEERNETFAEVATHHRRSLGKNCDTELLALLCGASGGSAEAGGGSNRRVKAPSRNAFEDIQ